MAVDVAFVDGKAAVIVALTGASGLLGGNLASLLVSEGHTVRCTRRQRSRVAHLALQDVDWIEAPLEDPDRLREAFLGADIVLHAAASTRQRRRATRDLIAANVEGTANVLQAVRAARVPRLLHVSSTAAVGVSIDGEPIDETAPWNLPERGLADGYATTKHLAEELVLAAVQAGQIDAVVVNPGFMFGPFDARPSSGRMILEVARGHVWFSSRGRSCFADARDVARGAWAAARHGRTGERYILGGPNLAYAEVLPLIADVVGVRRPIAIAPDPLVRSIGLAGDVRAALSGREPAFTSGTARWALEKGFVFRSDKSRAELGYTTGDLSTAIADAWAWLRSVETKGPVSP